MHRNTKAMLDRVVAPDEQTPELEMLMDRLESVTSYLGGPVDRIMVTAVLVSAGYGKVKAVPEPEPEVKEEAKAEPKTPEVKKPKMEDLYDEEATIEDWKVVEKGKKVKVRRGFEEYDGAYIGIEEEMLMVNVKNRQVQFAPKDVRIP